jgi:UDP-N-acetylmuramoyl-tripeptide--D-alanyl-D-alanine ligase
MPKDSEMAIIEIGTNNPGEVEFLSNMVEPNFGLITNIGKEHLEGFGTIEAVAKEESELFKHLLDHKGFAFVNADDEWILRMSRNLDKKTFSKSDLEIQSLVPSIEFNYKSELFKSPLMGDYNLDNICTAIAVGEHFQVDIKDIVDAISSYSPENNRSQIIENNSNVIWLDAYNANPSSMEKAIENFNAMPQQQKVLILGDMFEMGEAALTEHKALLQFARKFGFSRIFVLGNAFREVASECGVKPSASMDELKDEIAVQQYENTAFLIKGSRGMKMEQVLDALTTE